MNIDGKEKFIRTPDIPFAIMFLFLIALVSYLVRVLFK